MEIVMYYQIRRGLPSGRMLFAGYIWGVTAAGQMERHPNWFYSLPRDFGMIMIAYYKQYCCLPGGLQGRTRIRYETSWWPFGRWSRPTPSIVAPSRVVKWTLEISICLW